MFLLYQSFILIHRGGFIHTYPAWELVNFSNLRIHVLLILNNSRLLSLFSLKLLSETSFYINFYAQSFWPHENGLNSYFLTILRELGVSIFHRRLIFSHSNLSLRQHYHLSWPTGRVFLILFSLRGHLSDSHIYSAVSVLAYCLEYAQTAFHVSLHGHLAPMKVCSVLMCTTQPFNYCLFNTNS